MIPVIETTMVKIEVYSKSYARHKDHWDIVLARVNALFGQLQQIPEQWRTYEEKFSHMVRWMDNIDDSLARMFKGINSPADFDVEKEKFQQICQDVEMRREDMKWLVQQLDQLVSHRY
jgi:nesprin-1